MRKVCLRLLIYLFTAAWNAPCSPWSFLSRSAVAARGKTLHTLLSRTQPHYVTSSTTDAGKAMRWRYLKMLPPANASSLCSLFMYEAWIIDCCSFLHWKLKSKPVPDWPLKSSNQPAFSKYCFLFFGALFTKIYNKTFCFIGGERKISA